MLFYKQRRICCESYSRFITELRNTVFQMGEEFFRASFFCGVGPGLDSGGTGGAQAINSADDGDGVRVQTRGPLSRGELTSCYSTNRGESVVNLIPGS